MPRPDRHRVVRIQRIEQRPAARTRLRRLVEQRVGGTLGGGGSNVDAGGVTVKPTTFTPALAAPTCRKIKDLLVGMPCSDDEVNTVDDDGPGRAAGADHQLGRPARTYQPMFQGKMVPFFRNLFQQVGFTPTQDFKPQLLENGGFDFGPFGTAAVGDDVYFKLVQNLQDSFALTAWQMVKEGTGALLRRADDASSS